MELNKMNPNHFLFQNQSGLLHSWMVLTAENGFLIKRKKSINKYLTSKQRVSNLTSLGRLPLLGSWTNTIHHCDLKRLKYLSDKLIP